MSTQQFTSELEKARKGAVVTLPFDPNAVWGEKRRHHITGTVDGHKVRGALKEKGRGYQLSLGAAWLRDHPVAVGTAVAVTLAPEGPQFADLAPDIAAALDETPEARAFFEALATFYRTGYLAWINGARQPVDRAARIVEMVALLQAGKKQR